MKIGIIDFGVGNINSIFSMYRYLGIKTVVVDSYNEISNLDKIILPGVGSFDYGMASIHKKGFFDILNKKVLIEQKPILGICLGMQIITNGSEEGNEGGFGWIEGFSKKFKFDNPGLKIPHMGWNNINKDKDHYILSNLNTNSRFYFSHGYHVECKNDNVIAKTDYGYSFVSIIAKENVIGVQFHPEKSHKFGMQLLKSFVKYS
ncbi:MAG: Imidazole glycerol phosphate synthase subunit HisH 1 [Alphaproteobacteria bacterium MarineAlpha2_Bin1]|nr:MAG: Imidazole glycerol phosphate synthase subunit HisH 1 [Alphaproteobacteria bacterium MarineAlpha2_Bin1]|tara:strand:+ start:2499 stop:3110 length:612 start_codon:yes stop_codon:yes gene_type:complete